MTKQVVHSNEQDRQKNYEIDFANIQLLKELDIQENTCYLF